MLRVTSIFGFNMFIELSYLNGMGVFVEQMYVQIKRAIRLLIQVPNFLLLIPIHDNGNHTIYSKKRTLSASIFNTKANSAIINISLAFPGRVLWTNGTRDGLTITMGTTGSVSDICINIP